VVKLNRFSRRDGLYGGLVYSPYMSAKEMAHTKNVLIALLFNEGAINWRSKFWSLGPLQPSVPNELDIMQGFGSPLSARQDGRATLVHSYRNLGIVRKIACYPKPAIDSKLLQPPLHCFRVIIFGDPKN
jgi:hypothetical protein